MVDRLVCHFKTKIMKRLIFYISIIFFSIISYSQEVVRPLIGADLLEGKGAAHFIDTTSTAQSKNGNLTLGGTLTITDLASDNLVIISPTAIGKQDTTETEDATTATFDTLKFDYGDVTNDLDIGDTLEFDNGFQLYNTYADTGYLKETVVKVEGDLHVTGHVTSEKSGGLCYVSTPGTQTINTGGTFERLNEGNIAYTADHLYNFTHDDGRLTYTGTQTIHVTITVAIAAESGEVAQVTNFRIAKDGTTIAATDMPITFTALDAAANTPLKWLDEVATDSYYEIFGTSNTDADEFDINTLVFTIAKH